MVTQTSPTEPSPVSQVTVVAPNPLPAGTGLGSAEMLGGEAVRVTVVEASTTAWVVPA